MLLSDKPGLMKKHKKKKIDRNASQSAQAGYFHEMIAEENLSPDSVDANRIMPQLFIPTLPVELDLLLQLNPSVHGQKSSSGLVTIYAGNKLILTLSAGDQFFIFNAWRGTEKLGVKVNWDKKSTQFEHCVDQDAYINCELKDQVHGLFEDDRLDHISWRFVDE